MEQGVGRGCEGKDGIGVAGPRGQNYGGPKTGRIF